MIMYRQNQDDLLSLFFFFEFKRQIHYLECADFVYKAAEKLFKCKRTHYKHPCVDIIKNLFLALPSNQILNAENNIGERVVARAPIGIWNGKVYK